MRALVQLLGEPAVVTAGGVREAVTSRLEPVLASPADAVALSLQLLGDAEGSLLLLFDRPGMVALLHRLTGLPEPLAEDLGRSTLQEIGNILVSSFLSSLGRGRRVTLLPSVPLLLEADPAALAEAVRHHLGPVGEQVLLLDFHFGLGPAGAVAAGRLLLLPTAEALRTLTDPAA